MTDHTALADTIIRSIRASGCHINCTTCKPSQGGEVKFLAWKDEGGEVRIHGAETWEGKWPDRYRAAVAMAEALGWELE